VCRRIRDPTDERDDPRAAFGPPCKRERDDGRREGAGQQKKAGRRGVYRETIRWCYKLSHKLPTDNAASERCERATRSERAGGAARERACRGVRGAKPLG